MPVNTELVTRLLNPISSDAPSGKDLRYDPRVDAIKEFRREELELPRDPDDRSTPSRKLADWPAVIKGATALLTEETKDLQLAAWLAEALLRKEGYAGLATGLEVLHGYVDRFWDSVYPLPEDDDFELRVGPLEWVGAKLEIPLRMASFGSTPVTFLQIVTSREVPSEAEAEADDARMAVRVEALSQGKLAPEKVNLALDALAKPAVRTVIADLDATMAALGKLEKSADERLGRDAPAFAALRRGLDEVRRFSAVLLAKRLETDPDPEIPEAESGADGVAGDDTALTVEPVNRADASQRLAVVAKWFRAQDPTNPAPYLMVRGFRWGELRAAVPDVDPKLLEAPPTATRARLKTMLIDGKWTDLLEQSEVLMASAPGRGWLDLQRYVLTACAQLGGNYDAVAAAVRSELRALLVAVPQLSRMTLMDDTPSANDETRQWLASEGLEPPAESAAEDDAATEAQPDSDPTDGADVLTDSLDDDAAAAQQGGFSRSRPVRRSAPARGRDAFDVARSELASGRPNRAIEVLMAELARDQSPRGRFVRQTQIAYIMVESGLDAVARPILAQLVDLISERQLENWESGALVAQPLALLCRVIDRSGGDEDQRRELYQRVCRLDPMQALALQSR